MDPSIGCWSVLVVNNCRGASDWLPCCGVLVYGGSEGWRFGMLFLPFSAWARAQQGTPPHGGCCFAQHLASQRRGVSVGQWSLAVSLNSDNQWQCGLRGPAHRESDGFGDQGHEGTCEVVVTLGFLVQLSLLCICALERAVGVRGSIVPTMNPCLGRLCRQARKPHSVGAPEGILVTQGVARMRQHMAV